MNRNTHRIARASLRVLLLAGCIHGACPLEAAENPKPNTIYDHVNDPHEWTNLAGNPEHAARLAIFRQQLTQRLPPPTDNPAPQKTDAEAWKDKFFKQHPEADANKDGVLSWPEYRAFKEKLDAEKKTRKPTKP